MQYWREVCAEAKRESAVFSERTERGKKEGKRGNRTVVLGLKIPSPPERFVPVHLTPACDKRTVETASTALVSIQETRDRAVEQTSLEYRNGQLNSGSLLLAESS